MGSGFYFWLVTLRCLGSGFFSIFPSCLSIYLILLSVLAVTHIFIRGWMLISYLGVVSIDGVLERPHYSNDFFIKDSGALGHCSGGSGHEINTST